MSGEGSGVTGTSYTLTCRVSLPSGVEPDSLDIQWLGLPTPQSVMISTGVYISNVTLNPLLPNNTGYTCTASYRINGVSSRLARATINISELAKKLYSDHKNIFTMQELETYQWRWWVQEQEQ